MSWGITFSIIYKTNEAIEYNLVVEVTCGKLLMEFMGDSAIKARGINYGMLRSASQVEEEVIDSL